MSANEALNIASLKMVHDELLATIEQSAIRLEQFSGDRTNGELLQSCIEGIKQIRGTLSLIQLKGVDILADELLEVRPEPVREGTGDVVQFLALAVNEAERRGPGGPGMAGHHAPPDHPVRRHRHLDGRTHRL